MNGPARTVKRVLTPPAMTTQLQQTIDVTMPQMGVSVDEGTVVDWKVAVGDVIQMDETICEISTDKVETEVPSPASGTVVEILVAVDSTVPVGTVLARIAAGESAAGVQSPPRAGADAGGTPAAVARRGYTPVVRRMAQAHSLDLDLITGTGRGGRVTKRDVLAHLEASAGTPSVKPSGSSALAAAAEPLSRMRRSIAEHMTRSVATSAHVHSFIEVDMSAVESARREHGVTALPIVARATIDALREHPYLNASIEGDSRVLHASINLGIAVSMGADGLIVPVVHDAQDLSVEGLASRIRDLAGRARDGSLTPDEVRGGTFTITNPGRVGTMMSTPIINQPQVGILALEGIAKHPVVVDDAIAIRPTTVLGLGWDHRAIDGMLAAEFLATLRSSLESWS
jgi:pyruvate/2-oxoglutarate dehydrogenase complex dihydrolipoamide acyltransferase (E2) component